MSAEMYGHKAPVPKSSTSSSSLSSKLRKSVIISETLPASGDGATQPQIDHTSQRTVPSGASAPASSSPNTVSSREDPSGVPAGTVLQKGAGGHYEKNKKRRAPGPPLPDQNIATQKQSNNPFGSDDEVEEPVDKVCIFQRISRFCWDLFRHIKCLFIYFFFLSGKVANFAKVSILRSNFFLFT